MWDGIIKKIKFTATTVISDPHRGLIIVDRLLHNTSSVVLVMPQTGMINL